MSSVAVVAYASRPDEVVLRGTLSTIAAQVHEAGIRRTAVIVVGSVLTASEFPDSHLYSARASRYLSAAGSRRYCCRREKASDERGDVGGGQS